MKTTLWSFGVDLSIYAAIVYEAFSPNRYVENLLIVARWFNWLGVLMALSALCVLVLGGHDLRYMKAAMSITQPKSFLVKAYQRFWTALTWLMMIFCAVVGQWSFFLALLILNLCRPAIKLAARTYLAEHAKNGQRLDYIDVEAGR